MMPCRSIKSVSLLPHPQEDMFLKENGDIKSYYGVGKI